MTTISARDFSQDVSAAKRAAAHGPVVVTDRGEPAYVLLTIEDYRHLAAADCDAFLARLRMDDDIDIEFDPARIVAQVPEF